MNNHNIDNPKALKSDLIEQEHRIFSIISNYIEYRNRNNDDPLKKAATKALFWRIAVALLPAAAVGTAGFIGIISIYLTYKANTLIDIQNSLSEASRRSALVYELSSILDRVNVFIDTKLEDEPKFKGKYSLPKHLRGRIMALSRSLKPYRYIDEDGQLLPRPLSPERGQLLVSLYESQVNTGEWIIDLDLRYADLRMAKLRNVDLAYADLRYADFRGADLRSAFIKFGKYEGADFRGANLEGVRVDRDFLTKKGIVIQKDKWIYKDDHLEKANSKKN